MKHKFTVTMLISSIVITGFAAIPAKAGNDDVAKILAGVATLYIIGKAINSNPKAESTVSRNTSRLGSDHRNYDYWEPSKKNRKTARRTLPEKCKFRIRTRNGRKSVFGARCLKNNYRFAHRLPQECKRNVRTRDGRRRVFGASCLRDHGYKVAGRHR